MLAQRSLAIWVIVGLPRLSPPCALTQEEPILNRHGAQMGEPIQNPTRCPHKTHLGSTWATQTIPTLIGKPIQISWRTSVGIPGVWVAHNTPWWGQQGRARMIPMPTLAQLAHAKPTWATIGHAMWVGEVCTLLQHVIELRINTVSRYKVCSLNSNKSNNKL